MSKSELRMFIKDKRVFYNSEDYAVNGRKIYEKVISSFHFINSQVIYCYVSVNGEVPTNDIIEKALSLGKTVAVPKIKDKIINFYKIESLDELESGYYHIPEPVHEIIAPQAELIIVPGVAFSKNCFRMGYGGGFYDRYLKESHYKMGLAFGFQVFDEIPVEKHDVRLDTVITECCEYTK